MFENILSNIFETTMQRESKTVTVLYSGDSFKAFFRKSAEGSETTDTMTMFYSVDSPLSVGSLISFAGNTYLCLNQETAENEVYMKSSVRRTNGTITTHDLTVADLPIYGETLNSATISENTYTSLLDGHMEVLTEDCSASRSLKIDDGFNCWGRTWKIENLYYIDGVCHIVISVAANYTPEFNYSLILSDLESVNVAPGDHAAITATALINGKETDAAIVYSSSDSGIATIDAAGQIEYLSEGSVSFFATWEEHVITVSSALVTVASAPSDDVVSIYVSPLSEISEDFPETLTYYGVRGGVRDDSISVSFAIENISNIRDNYAAYLKKITVVDNGDHTITLNVKGSVMVGKTFDLVATSAESETENRQTIKITSFF